MVKQLVTKATTKLMVSMTKSVRRIYPPLVLEGNAGAQGLGYAGRGLGLKIARQSSPDSARVA